MASTRSYHAQERPVKPHRGSSMQPDHIMLSFSDDPHTTATVTWRTCVDAPDGALLIWEQENGQPQRVPARTREFRSDIDISRMHWATARGLRPGMRYTYAVESGGIQTGPFSFQTEEENCRRFQFLIIADPQTEEPFGAPDYAEMRRVLIAALKAHPNCRFLLTLGDNVDNGMNELQWNGFFHGLQGICESLPLMMATGNHDNRGFKAYFPEMSGKFYLDHADFFDAQFEGSYPPNGPPGFQTENYSFDYGNVHFLIMGVNEQPQWSSWAYEDLRQSDQEWKLGFYHYPVFPVMPEGENLDTYPHLQRAIEEGRADVMFAGHDHSLARSFPIRNFELFDRPSEGTVHFLLGGGADNGCTYNASKLWYDKFNPHGERQSMYAVAEVDGPVLTVTAYWEDGRPCDRFTIDKARDQIDPPSTAPIYKETRMAFKGALLELTARNLYPMQKDGVWYAPFAQVIQFIGGTVEKRPGSVLLGAYGHRATFYEEERRVDTPAGTQQMEHAAFLEREQLYLPVADSARLFGMTWHYSARNNIIDWEYPAEKASVAPQPPKKGGSDK